MSNNNTEISSTGPAVLQEISSNNNNGSSSSSSSSSNDLTNVCNNFMYHKCSHRNCRYIHDKALCFHFWKGTCKYGDTCKKNHFLTHSSSASSSNVSSSVLNTKTTTVSSDVTGSSSNAAVTTTTSSQSHSASTTNNNHQRRRKPKNTEVFEPSFKPTDMRLVYDINPHKFNVPITSRDVVLCPNVFGEYKPGELYTRLVSEINSCGVPLDQLLKLWHGNDKIEGTHLICDDKRRWKDRCPTFDMVINRLQDYFAMKIQATRLNWYVDTSQWKPYHHDSAYVNPEKAAVQNFTVAVSFGATRVAAFEHATTRTTLSLPQPDGTIYAFCKDTNGIWRHGILQEKVTRDEGRISIIAWGWVNYMEDVPQDEE